MNNQESRKPLTFVAALFAIFAFPALMCAQTAPTTTTPAKKPAAVPMKPAATQPKAATPPARVVTPAAQTVVQPKTTTTAVQSTVAAPAVQSVAAQPTPATPVPATNKQPVQSVVPRAQTPATSAGAGTLTWGNVIYTPAGCVHNGAKAVCTFTLANHVNAVTLQAPWQMNTLQFVDDAQVPHIADAAYFVDNYGTRQAQLFVNSGESGTLVREFPNVNDQVASGEFHLANQVVGGVSVAAPGTIPGQAPAVANSPVQAVQPVVPNSPRQHHSG